MDWRDIPSLSALRAFEAAARLGSYSEAARALNVTHAAIAQHVRTLEAHFGQALMARAGRGVAPTEAGARLARDLSAGFGEIAGGVRALMQGRADRPVTVTTTPSFAEAWLMPRLAQFWSAHPEVPLSVSAEARVSDLRRDGYDLAIRYGRGDWPGLESLRLTDPGIVAVAAPQVAQRLAGAWPDPEAEGALKRLDRLRWLVDPQDAEFYAWLRAGGIDPDALQATRLETNPMVLAACRSGAGVSVQPRAVVEGDLAEGRLVVLAEQSDSPLAYHLVHLPGPMPPRVKTFVTWLRRSMTP
ncbi:AHCY transcriptional activator hvrB [Roseibacterium elongatum DSM 19469]|uniref:AHCY transcriptional activator hvrB n=1 Tax=Roseicyclus elongatus DSM 19469 TaxID=1294273 RepID=W8RRG8_9RHOB|nr:LysR family transcriptional regulator [Roseibacterium elongatum]AHM03774.1 AHCY transcriptional activator hvrB [Roseibacterium elongatum DSM 19469]